MKPLTGLPTSDYLKISQEAKIQLSDLLRLVQELEAGTTAAYIAHYRPDLAAGLDEEQIRAIETRLGQFLDFEDRRVTILTAINQQDRLTPELRARLEAVTDRRELEDLYLPFKPKRRSAADEGVEKGLEPLARFLWDQKPEDADIEGVARGYVDSEKGIPNVSEALRLARSIVARWLAEDADIRRELRRIMHDEAEVVVSPGESGGREKASNQKFRSLLGYRAKIKNVPWRQVLAVRKAAKEGAARLEPVLPENRAVSYLLGRLIGTPRSLFCLQLGAAAREAFLSHLARLFANELLQDLEERADQDAIRVFSKNLRKLLLTPPGGRKVVVGLETGRPGGWRAAAVGTDGQFLEGVVIGEPAAEQPHEPPQKEQPAADGNASATSDTPPPAESGSQVQEAETRAPQGNSSEGGTATGPSEIAAAEGSVQDQSAEPADLEQDSAEVGQTVSEEKAEAAPDAPAGKADPGSASESKAVATPPAEGAAENSSPKTEQKQPAEASHRAPGPPQQAEARSNERKKAVETRRAPLSEILKKHEVSAVVMANGPGIRQVERAIRSAIREAGAPKTFWTTVNDSGSWIYATSKVARHEMPEVEPAVRSAVCLARRFQDPLSEFTRVDPRLLGIGQFHHQVDAKRLRSGLRVTLESTVHEVGIDLNTASTELLAMVPGSTERLAKRIVQRRDKDGPFTRREQLREVAGLNERIYKQAVGFTRVHGGENPLDATGLHPDHYPAAEKLFAAAGLPADEALDKPESLTALTLEEISDEQHPVEVLRSIVQQLQPPARNPRGEFVPPQMPVELRAAGELKAGMKVEGVVTNTASFGVFIDIGADQDGLVHVSRLLDKFTKDPHGAAKVGDRVSVYILALDEGGKRISLSMKDPREIRAAGSQARSQPPGRARRAVAADGRRSNGARRRRKEPGRDGGKMARSFGPDAKQKAREAKEVDKLSLEEKLALLQTKYRTKV